MKQPIEITLADLQRVAAIAGGISPGQPSPGGPGIPPAAGGLVQTMQGGEDFMQKAERGLTTLKSVLELVKDIQIRQAQAKAGGSGAGGDSPLKLILTGLYEKHGDMSLGEALAVIMEKYGDMKLSQLIKFL